MTPKPPLPRRPAPAPPPARGLPPAVKLGLLVFGLAVVAAALADLQALFRHREETVPEDPRGWTPGYGGTRYADPEGRFALTHPAAWKLRHGEDARPFTVMVQGPSGLELDILVHPFPHDDFDRMRKELESQENELSVPMNMTEVTFQGHRALERTVRLTGRQVLVIDFLVGREAHHLQFEAPREDFDRLLPLMREVLSAYEPRPSPAP